MIIIQGSGNVITITMTKHSNTDYKNYKAYCVLIIKMASQMKRRYNVCKQTLFSIGTIN